MRGVANFKFPQTLNLHRSATTTNITMTQLLSPQFFQNAYDEMENDLQQRSQNNTLCKYCIEKDIPSLFKPGAIQPSVQEVRKDHGSLSDLAARKHCPFCRVVCRLVEQGAGANCCGDCRRCYPPTENPDSSIDVRICPQPYRRVGAVAVFGLPGSELNYHVAHGDIHLVHPTQADHFRIREWINTCDASHTSCNAHVRAPDALFGHGKYALRLIDVELRMIVKSLHPVRYITLSYVWGASANRRFDMAPNPNPDMSRFPPGIEPVDRQIPEMMFGRLGRTFEDLICFTRRLGERYIWIDAICIPQDEPDILGRQVLLMDQIYFHGICNVVSLGSGVDDGLPGASSATPRDTKQLVEQFTDGSRIATPLWELSAWIEYAPWVTRGWTLQEHLLAKRSIFFAQHEAVFVCKEMSAKESWKYPRTAADTDPSEPADRWSQYTIPLPSGKCDLNSELTNTLSTIVQMYTTRNLTYASDRHPAFQGLSARLSEAYDIEFLHAHPVSETHFPPSLLWGRVDFRDSKPSTAITTPADVNHNWPSWSWLSHPFAIAYKYWAPWKDDPDFLEHGALVTPETDIRLKFHNNKFYPLPSPTTNKTDPFLPTPQSTPPKVVKIHGLSLDIDTTQWPPSQRRNLAHAMYLWDNKAFPTPARGAITFNLVVIPDLLPTNGNHGFPLGTTKIRLLHVGNSDALKPKMPLLLTRGENARRISPGTVEQGETEYSKDIDWVEPDYSDKNNCLGVEPDVYLLIVEAADEGVVVKRLGIAFVRVMDFLIAGARVGEVLLG